MKLGSLFTGIGGFDVGFERAGLEPTWQVEIDEQCQGVLQKHFPDVKRYSDVKRCEGRHLSAVDVICGGFPCQDVSVAGGRAGLAGERSGLWFEFERILRETGPKWVVIENVAGLLSSNEGADFRVIIRGLVKLGYRVVWRVLDAQYFGVAQRRRRLFIVGCITDGGSAEVLLEPEGGTGYPPSREKARQGTAATIVSRAGKGSFTDPVNDNIYPVVPFDVRNLAEGQDITHTLQSKQSGGYSLNYLPLISGTISSKWAKGSGGPAGDEAQNLVWQNKQNSGEIRVQGDTMPTMTQHWGTGGNNVPFVGVRRLTPVECEKLQGFEPGWTAGQSDSARYRQLGNAVAVPVAEWIGKRIIRANKGDNYDTERQRREQS
jgi:DNA (cytosine-5)-methyltransferase 1